MKFVTLQDHRSGSIILYLIENYDPTQKARLRVGTEEYLAILERSTFESEHGRSEWWLRTGSRIANVEQDADDQLPARAESEAE
ncbi:MAG: hypothetical protein MUF31_18440 [Akkermansiaceae bacterium]|nr:hypothetical protein [Akkermansiaceae bacterium]